MAKIIKITHNKNTPATHKHLAKIYNKLIEDPTMTLPWLCEGRTVLLFEEGDPKGSENYRPITRLNVMYKSFANVLYELSLETI